MFYPQEIRNRKHKVPVVTGPADRVLVLGASALTRPSGSACSLSCALVRFLELENGIFIGMDRRVTESQFKPFLSASDVKL